MACDSHMQHYTLEIACICNPTSMLPVCLISSASIVVAGNGSPINTSNQWVPITLVSF